ncbi:hypothetical protein cyc_00941 [Cyclospora cayetanensis]|uniref:Uncharacterized protein n=1 Tax=Cyclospora cayetanensis TaxID=88456 RepID=A0A1D3CU60_9EIME|nr:hypothetical protein cyc_00941 [Cyclospora cayetanensis]
MQPNCWTEEKAHERRKPIEESNTANTYIRNGRSTSTVSSIVGQTKRPSDSQRFRASSVMSQLLFASQAHRRFHHLRSHQKPIHERPPQAHFLGKFSTDRQQRWLPLTHVPGLCHTKEPARGESCLDIVLSPGSDSLPSCKEEKRVQVPPHQEQEDVLSHVPIENSSEASDALRRGLDYIGQCGRKARQAGDGTVAGSVLHSFDLTTAAPPVLCVSTSSTSPSGSSSSFDATRRVLIPPDGGSQQQSDMPGCGQGMQSRSSICLGRKHPAWAARARAAATKTCNAIRGVPMSLPCVELSLGYLPLGSANAHGSFLGYNATDANGSGASREPSISAIVFTTAVLLLISSLCCEEPLILPLTSSVSHEKAAETDEGSGIAWFCVYLERYPAQEGREASNSVLETAW